MSDSVQRPQFQVLAAIRRFFRILLRHSLPSLVLVIGTEIVLVVGAFTGFFTANMHYFVRQQGESPSAGLFLGLIAGAMLLGCATAPSLAAYAAGCEQEHRRPRFVEAWSVLWRHTPMSLLIQGLQTGMIALGLVLLIVPGLIVSVVVSLAVPARVVEGIGPLKSISRSIDLTRGLRWRLFGYNLLVGLLVPLLIVLGPLALNVLGPGIQTLNQGASMVPYMVVSIILSAIVLAYIGLVAYVSGLGPAAALAEIRAGAEARTVSAVFD